MSPLLTVTTTLASESEARALARRALEDKLAACAQIQAIQSLYTWDGALQEDNEWQVSFKTAKRRAKELIAFIEVSHPYEVPQILITEISFASEAYIAWVYASTKAHD